MNKTQVIKYLGYFLCTIIFLAIPKSSSIWDCFKNTNMSVERKVRPSIQEESIDTEKKHDLQSIYTEPVEVKVSSLDSKPKSSSFTPGNSYFVHKLMDGTDFYVTNDKIHNHTFVIGREHNRRLPLVSDEQKKAFHTIVFTTCNLESFVEIYRQYPDIGRELGIQFVTNMMIEYDLLQNSTLKYEEHSNMYRLATSEEIHKFLHTSFMHRTSKTRSSLPSFRVGKKKGAAAIKNTVQTGGIKEKATDQAKMKKSPRKTKKNSNEESTQLQSFPFISANDKSHPIHKWMKYGYKFYKNIRQDEWCAAIIDGKDLHAMQKSYSPSQYREELSHSLFSIIHPLYEEYDLFVLNGSHRVAYGKTNVPTNRPSIHSNTKLKLKFCDPMKTNLQSFFVIFNSRLVHCGAKSKRENILAPNPKVNHRIFAYAVSSFSDTKTKLFSRRKNDKEKDHNEAKGEAKGHDEEAKGHDDEAKGHDHEEDFMYEYTRNNTIDQTSFTVCDPTKCDVCKKWPNNKNTNVVIDIEKEYLAHKKSGFKKKFDRNQIPRPTSYLCGDLDVHGWEIHYGIKYLKDSDSFKFLRAHLEYLHNHGGKNWKQITKSKGRYYMKLEETVDVKNKQCTYSMKYLRDVCYTQISDIVENIVGFRNHCLQGRTILANRKHCIEQHYHKDYYPPLPSNSTSHAASSSTSTAKVVIPNNDDNVGKEGDMGSLKSYTGKDVMDKKNKDVQNEDDQNEDDEIPYGKSLLELALEKDPSVKTRNYKRQRRGYY